MKYIVMETHYSYAILLDEEGRFVKAANLHYEVGDTVTNIVEMMNPPAKKINKRLNTILAAAIACLIFMVTSYINHQTYASVFMVINPEVRIDVNRKDEVIDVAGINADGVKLVAGYSYQEKSLESVMDELVDRAIEMEYLSAGKEVTLTLDAKNNQWIVDNEERLQTHVNNYVKDKITIETEVTSEQEITDDGISDYDDHYVDDDYDDDDDDDDD